jgi:error-prone DNA polymerase
VSAPLRVSEDAQRRPKTIEIVDRRLHVHTLETMSSDRVHAEGPERLSGEWNGGREAREYWRVEFPSGWLALVYRDARSGEWFLEGWFDRSEAREDVTDSYVELHCHSGFSLGDGASTPEALAARAAELGYTALALTDHDDLGGAVRFSNACREVGVRPILGAELTLDDDSHLTLLAEDVAGWRNLAALITHARGQNSRGHPSLSFDVLATHTAGLVALSGCPRGRIPRALAQGRYATAPSAAAQLRDIFGDALYLEIWDHHTHGEASLCADLLDLAAEFDLPWTITHNVHYATPAGRHVHNLLVCTRRGLTIAEAEAQGLLRPSAEWRLQLPMDVARRWRTLHQGGQRTLEITERCAFQVSDPRPAPPAYPLPAVWLSADDYLEHLAQPGLRERLPEASERHHRQLRHELDMIRRLGLADHFLIPWDICRDVPGKGIRCQLAGLLRAPRHGGR